MNVPYNNVDEAESSTASLAETRSALPFSSLLRLMITVSIHVDYARSRPIFQNKMPVTFTTISHGEKSDTYNVYGDLHLRHTCEGGEP